MRMRIWLYVAVGIGTFSLGGLIIGRPFGDPIIIVVGAVIGLLVATIRQSTVRRRPRRSLGLDICDPCWRGDHDTGIPCPLASPTGSTCQCARCSPFIGRYAPEDSPSYVRDFDDN